MQKKKPKTKTVTVTAWANVYDDARWVYRTRYEANLYASKSNRIALVKLTGSYEVPIKTKGKKK